MIIHARDHMSTTLIKLGRSRVSKTKAMIIAVMAFFSAGIAIAATYFLVSFNMSMAQDMQSEWSSAKNFFSISQPTLNKAGLWRPGDFFIVNYNGGAIVKFKLSTRGMRCAFGRCVFDTSQPFDDTPEIVQPGLPVSAMPTNVIVSGIGSLIPPTIYNITPAYPAFPMSYWTITVGPLTDSGGGRVRPPPAASY